jgi:hypothetical protein
MLGELPSLEDGDRPDLNTRDSERFQKVAHLPLSVSGSGRKDNKPPRETCRSQAPRVPSLGVNMRQGGVYKQEREMLRRSTRRAHISLCFARRGAIHGKLRNIIK